jgi:hypothetical protein
MSGRTNNTNNVNLTKHVAGTPNDEHSKPQSGTPFAVQSTNGNAIEIWSDGAVWDTVASAFINIDKVKRL